MGVNTQNLRWHWQFGKLWKPPELPDVTLVHGDVQQYMAHKVMLTKHNICWRACPSIIQKMPLYKCVDALPCPSKPHCHSYALPWTSIIKKMPFHHQKMPLLYMYWCPSMLFQTPLHFLCPSMPFKTLIWYGKARCPACPANWCPSKPHCTSYALPWPSKP